MAQHEPAQARPHLEDVPFGATTVLFGEQGGKYPSGNSLLVQGRDGSLVVDPSLGLVARSRAGQLSPEAAGADRVLNSHCHEDHVAGNHLYPGVPWHLHEDDLPGIRSLDAMMAIYGYPEPVSSALREAVVQQFHFTPREDAQAFRDGEVFDLGGVSVEVVHTPGHTRGHSCLHVHDGEGDLLYLGDIDLSSFGPYYGDAWSCLEDFERSLARVREIDVRWYATFHHVGVLEGREAFLARLERFAAALARRETRLLEYLAEPHDLDEIARHRFVYRPGDAIPWADPVERRHMQQHVERLVRQDRLEEVEPGRYRVRGRTAP